MEGRGRRLPTSMIDSSILRCPGEEGISAEFRRARGILLRDTKI